MKPVLHCKASVKRYGGQIEDYLKYHNYIDSSKSSVADIRHRAILHSAFGIFILEDVFGPTFINSDGREISVRDIAEEHVIEDLGFIPSMENWLNNMTIQPWMSGTMRKTAKKSLIKLRREKENV